MPNKSLHPQLPVLVPRSMAHYNRDIFHVSTLGIVRMVHTIFDVVLS
jgi:F420-dependent methylenetetrahydromethanopterin dehydrogenase